MNIAEKKKRTKPHSSPGVATFFAFRVVELVSARVSGLSARPAVDGAEMSSCFEAVVPVDAERFCAWSDIVDAPSEREGKRDEGRGTGRAKVEATIVDTWWRESRDVRGGWGLCATKLMRR